MSKTNQLLIMFMMDGSNGPPFMRLTSSALLAMNALLQAESDLLAPPKQLKGVSAETAG